jgi:hypothetical protein
VSRKDFPKEVLQEKHSKYKTMKVHGAQIKPVSQKHCRITNYINSWFSTLLAIQNHL